MHTYVDLRYLSNLITYVHFSLFTVLIHSYALMLNNFILGLNFSNLFVQQILCKISDILIFHRKETVLFSIFDLSKISSQ